MHYVKAGPLPDHLSARGNDIVYARRCSPPMSDEEANDLALRAQNSVDLDEGGFKHEFVARLAPDAASFSQSSVSRTMPFYPHTIPREPTATTNPVQPKPDITYGYRHDSYRPFQQWANEQTYDGLSAYRYTEISRGNSLPFFIWEVKSQATGGNIYHAVNQAITAGSTLVQAAMLLAKLANKYSDQRLSEPENTIAFSLAIDTVTAQLNVHWYSPESFKFMTQPIQTFSLADPAAMPKLQQATKNILDWGYRDRHKLIMDQLTVLFSVSGTVPFLGGATMSLGEEASFVSHQAMLQDYRTWCQTKTTNDSAPISPESLHMDPVSPPSSTPSPAVDAAVIRLEHSGPKRRRLNR